MIAAGTNADIVALWYPELSEEQRAERTAEFDRVTAVEGAAAAVGIEGAAEAIGALHAAGFRLGLATNDFALGARQTLAALGLAGMFDAVFGYDWSPRPSPRPTSSTPLPA